MPLRDRARRLALSVASDMEQEIRAHPCVYAAFYRSIGRHDGLRRLVGAAKDGVRRDQLPERRVVDPVDDPRVVRRRENAIAARLGLDA